jgi:hypothetical protein
MNSSNSIEEKNDLNNINEYEIKKEIILLEEEITAKKNKLFLYRLSKLYKHSPNISGITIEVDPANVSWNIKYTHETNNYNHNYYNVGDNLEMDSYKKHTKISIGKNKKYFIKGGISYNIYRNSNNELRIINKEYDLELDMSEQRNLIIRYSRNHDIPEYMALSILLYISDNKWDDESIIHYLSII